jgi:hypothetical protein
MSEFIIVNQEGETVTLSKSDWEKVVKVLSTSRTQAKTPNKSNAPKMKMKRGPYKKKVTETK